MRTKRKLGFGKRRISFEHLEDRRMMTGNVNAEVRGGVLYLTGDGGGNRVDIAEVAGQLKISDGGAGTTINHKSSVSLGSFTSIVANLGGGDDMLTIRHLNSPLRNVTLDTGTGADAVNLGANTFTGNLTISGQGSLNVDSLHNRVVVGGTTRITGGAGNDHIHLEGGFNSVIISTGAGDDRVSLDGGGVGASKFTASTVTVDTGAGRDKLAATYGTVDHLYANLGSGDDALLVRNFQFRGFSYIDGGAGRNTFEPLVGVTGPVSYLNLHKL